MSALTRTNATTATDRIVVEFRSMNNADKNASKLFDSLVETYNISTWDTAKEFAIGCADDAVATGRVKSGDERKKFANFARNGLDRAMKRAGYEGRPSKTPVVRYLTRAGIEAVISDSFGDELIDFLAQHSDSDVAKKLLADLESASE